MTFMPIQLPPGIVRGANPDDVPGRWYDGNLIRWREGIMEPVGGWSRVTSTALSSTPRRIHQWKRNDLITMTVVGCDSHLYADNNGTYNDVAPADLVGLTTAAAGGFGTGPYGDDTYGTARVGTTSLGPRRDAWTFANWGEDLIAVASSDGRLLYFDATSPTVDVVPIGVYAISTISRTSNVTTVVTSTPHNLTTSDVVDINGVSDNTFNANGKTVTVTNATTFTYANTGSDGSSSGGTITDTSIPTDNRAVVVTPERHVMAIGAGGEARRVAWSSREDHTDWNYASTTNTAGFLDLQTETPLITGCAVREGTLVWSGNRAFLVRFVGQPFVYGADELGSTKLYAPSAFAEMDGRCVWMDASGFMIYEGGSMRPLPSPMTDYVYSDISALHGPRVAHAAVNGKFDEVWFYYPSSGSSECDRYVVWNYSENWWSKGSIARTAAFPATVSGYPLMTGTDGHLYQHEDGWTYDAFNCEGNIFVASGTINLPGDEMNMNVTQLIPSNGANYNLTKYTLFTRLTPGGAERQFGPYYSRADGYVDCRATGRDVRIRVCANAAGDWSIGRMRLKLGSTGGKR